MPKGDSEVLRFVHPGSYIYKEWFYLPYFMNHLVYRNVLYMSVLG